jgi:4-hydroxyacetophenone monooxygenase
MARQLLSRRGCRYPNHLYSFTNAPYDCSMYYALRDELHAYLEDVAEKFSLRSHIRLETEVKSTEYEQSDPTVGGCSSG